MIPTEPAADRSEDTGTPPSSETTPKPAPVAAEEADQSPVDQETLEAVQNELDQALLKVKENWDLYLGAHAEMENLRKRTEREVQNAHKFALERFCNELLPARDSLELGLAAASDETDITKLREGVELTLKQLAAAMEKFGVSQLDPLGERFNPTHQEAMAMLPTDQSEPNTVVQVVQKGYVLNDRLIRPAKVIVAQALPPSS